MNWTLLADFYELTMLGGYFRLGKLDERSTFDLYFRRAPFQGSFCIAAGLEQVIEWVENLHFDKSDIDYLHGLKIFPPDFLEYLKTFSFRGNLWAVPEGTLVFANEPLIRVDAALPQAQYLETALLADIGFQTLVATKASRVCLAAQGREVIEFGGRRAQGRNGALAASRAAYIGGCVGTSNTLAGKLFGIPVRGTQAHSWIQSFDSELEAFQKYAQVYPANTLLLIDTYNTIEGAKNAIKVALELRKAGFKFLGFRLDSGDLKKLSVEVRRLADEAGLIEAKIFASNELDEWIIQELLLQGAQLDAFGVGTSLVTAKPDAALGVVYKLVAVEKDGKMVPKIKISGNVEKMTNPGIKKIIRFFQQGKLASDVLILDDEIPQPSMTTFDQVHFFKKRILSGAFEEVLQPIFLNGQLVYRSPSLAEIRERTLNQLSLLEPEYKRLMNPEIYWVGLSERLMELKQNLLKQH